MVTHTTRNNLAKSEAGDNYQTTRTGNNSNADLIDAALAKCNFASATDPTTNDDSGDGYASGSVWHNTTAGRKWVCKVATVGAAVWWQVAISGVAFDFGAVEVRALTFQSDIATGAGAPLVVASTTKVTNLNSDKLDDLEGAAYAILVGQSGGQTLEGDTASGGNLTLKSTHHATKGSILFGTSTYDEVNNRLGIGSTSPTEKIESSGAVSARGGAAVNAAGKTALDYAAGGRIVVWGPDASTNSGFTIISLRSDGSNAISFIAIDAAGNAVFPHNVSVESLTDRTPAYEGNALAELDKVVAKNGKIDHAKLPEFCQKEYIDSEGKSQIGRDIGGMVSVLTVGIQQLKEFYENAVAERDKKIAVLAARLDKLEAASTKR